MKLLWGYSDFSSLLDSRPSLRSGIVVDTNVLISATYDFDTFFEETIELLDILVENQIPLFCNVNVRVEFLEIQRRIIFTEALLSFENATKRSSLPFELAKKLSSLRSNQSAREKDGRSPLRLSEADIKNIKNLMIREVSLAGNLWFSFCKDYVNDQLLNIWAEVVEQVGLNFLSIRQEDQDNYITAPTDWDKTIEFMSSEGVSSSDAMILNMYQSSKFEAILSSDADIGISVFRMNRADKFVILPDAVAKSVQIIKSAVSHSKK